MHPLGALTQGLEGKLLTDMAALEEAGCVGVSNALEPVTDTLVMRRAMEYAATFDLTVYLHAEDPWLRNSGCVHEGEVGTRLGLPGIPEAAETVARGARPGPHRADRRARALLQPFQRARRGHAGRGAETGTAGDRGRDRAPPASHRTRHRILQHPVPRAPAAARLRDRDALRAALKGGVISAICSDHQPHEPDAKLAPFAESEPGISGLETLLPLTLKLVEEKLLTLNEAIALLTVKPAEILGVECGTLSVGATADICIFDPKAHWILNADKFVSRGRNSPFLGWEFTGRVTHTLVGGEVVFELGGA